MLATMISCMVSYSHFTYTCSQCQHTYRMKPTENTESDTIIVTNMGAKTIDDEKNKETVTAL